MACPRGLPGTVHPVGIVRAGAQSSDVDVPEEKGPVHPGVERDDLSGFWVIVLVEQEQLHPGRIPREDREVDSIGVRRGAGRMRPSWLNGISCCHHLSFLPLRDEDMPGTCRDCDPRLVERALQIPGRGATDQPAYR